MTATLRSDLKVDALRGYWVSMRLRLSMKRASCTASRLVSMWISCRFMISRTPSFINMTCSMVVNEWVVVMMAMGIWRMCCSQSMRSHGMSTGTRWMSLCRVMPLSNMRRYDLSSTMSMTIRLLNAYDVLLSLLQDVYYDMFCLAFCPNGGWRENQGQARLSLKLCCLLWDGHDFNERFF